MLFEKKFDGVVEAVHYDPDGRVAWVRAYERRGPTFSDRVMLNRQELVERLRAGKHFVAGKRLEGLSSTFDVSLPLRLVEQEDGPVLVVGYLHPEKDCLEGVPTI